METNNTTYQKRTFKKSDLPDKSLQKLIEVGSKVMCVDGSYTLSIPFKSKELQKIYLGLSDNVFTVVAVNVPCPRENASSNLSPSNNCIIADDEGGIHFVSHVNIRNIESII